MSLNETAWFSGFADGEASFVIGKSGYLTHGHTYDSRFVPSFTIEVRADDAEIILRIKDTFGGSIHTRDRKDHRGYNRRPTIALHINGKENLARLASYFDRFPLHSKKARDFAVWREAVRIYISDGWAGEGLADLHDEIRAAREYQEA